MRLKENTMQIIMKKIFLISTILIILSILVITSCKKEESSGDGIVPVIVVLGLNPMYWAQDIPYIDMGATAYDISAAGDTVDLTNSIIVQNNVDVVIVGDYTVTYNVKDESGESAEEKVRSVEVVIGK